MNKRPEIRKRIKQFIETSLKRRGFPPTIREITTYFKFSYPSLAQYHLSVLKAEGTLKFRQLKQRRASRGLKIRKK